MLKQSVGFLSSNKNMNDFANIFTLDFSIFRHDHEERIYPNWMVRYVESATLEEQWIYFMAFRKIEAQLEKPDYLIDQLKWILKGKTIEFEYDFYVQLMFDEDVDFYDLFKSGCFEQLYQTYNTRFDKEYSEIVSPTEEAEAFGSDFEEDTLLF